MNMGAWRGAGGSLGEESQKRVPMTKRSFRHAVTWAYTMNWGENGFTALFTFVLASILGPRDFGIVSMAGIYIAFLQMFMDQGLAAALIQRKELDREHLDSVFWVNMVLGLVLVALSLAFSGWWARVNHLPELSLVIGVLSLAIPIEGLTIVQKAILQREMDFRSLAIRSNASVLIGGVIGLSMAFKGFGVWALVGQRLSQDVAAVVLLWGLSHWRPNRHFSLRGISDLLGFSTASFVNKMGDFLNSQCDALLMGLFFGPVAVGLYRLAHRLMYMVLDGATSSLQAVSFPQFSRFQDQPEELRQSVLSCIRISATVTLPAMAGLAAVSNLLIAAVGPNWGPAADALKILCLLGVALMFAKFTGPLLQALSRPHHLAALTWTVNALGIGIMLLCALLLKNASVWGQVVGISVARFVTIALILTPIFLFFLLRLAQISMKQLIRTVAPSAASAVTVVLAVMALLWTGAPQALPPILGLALAVALGGVVGVSTLLALDIKLQNTTLGLFSRLVRNEKIRT